MRDQQPNYSKSRTFPGFVRAIDEEKGQVTAIVSVTGVIDDYHSMIPLGAFSKSIAERARHWQVVDNHNYDSISRIVGICISAREISREELPEQIRREFPKATGGLETVTQYLLDTPEGKGAFLRIKSGAIRQYSIGFDAFDIDYQEFDMGGGAKMEVAIFRTVRIWEYSPVMWGANPATVTVDVRNSPQISAMLDRARLMEVLQGDFENYDISKEDFESAMDKLIDDLNENLPFDLELELDIEAESETEMDVLTYIYNHDIPTADQVRAGRVLSESNATKLMDAWRAIGAVLEAAGITEESDETDTEDQMGNNPSTAQSDEPEAGPLSAPTLEKLRRAIDLEEAEIDLL